MSGDQAVQVPNPYKAALRRARQSSEAAATALETALRAARTAMNEGAWSGPMGDDFSGELDSYRSKLNNAGTAAMTTFDTAIANEDEMVPATAWQVRWQRMF